MQTIRATAPHGRAIQATADLLSRLRLDFVFVGSVARSAWLDREIDRDAIDVLTLMTPEQKNQVAMMASNRGFRVDRDEVEQTAELDLVPLNFADPAGEVRVHVLVASNALYGQMVASGREARLDDRTLRVVSAEDLALLLAFSDDEESGRDRECLIGSAGFDRPSFNRKVESIGLGNLVIAE